MLDQDRRRDFEAAFTALLLRFGAREEGLCGQVREAVDQLLTALPHSSDDGTSPSALEVVRIRANKFAAVRLPPALHRDPGQLAILRREIQRIATRLLGAEARAKDPF